ncbi:2-polyprenyl-6-methoxyphenol hydroxylase-like FAD-dependent oxidoreductase [Actinoalloteichus hoggarensis]|uniref:Pentachlorophenol 4-monooxygenase n=1 Tax=Actinoalloteichus hoggarensis TaxID=1470176 RepID=A0A221VZ03_9PSEU|nr:FAD-dependent monooxygenase [Actinoalloteichus hoggarensis]ASO18773.1 Pentachlorophenol 4-monooxygenase [Actinoalloteichus hoggarensis]MBB5920006.1 2-polyprenyl-6-methoxyphenol hydroxylase-like FAD-dependent oxidoreductase [Actinoalloteichus hoggarensis]
MTIATTTPDRHPEREPAAADVRTDVLIVGAGPNGLLLACELAQAGVHPIVVERLAEPSDRPKANGLVGRVVQALDYRGLHERLSGHDRPPFRLPGFQFGALPLDLAAMTNHELFVLPVAQQRIEEVLADRAAELGVEIRRGHELIGLHQDAARVTTQVDGPAGRQEIAARFLVGADGGRSSVRRLCGIEFPGVTDSGFVQRSGQVVIHPPVALGETGDLEVDGVGRLRSATFTRTERGMFAYGMVQPGRYRVAVYESSPEPVPADTAMSIEELRDAVRRVLGGDVPMSEPADGAPSILERTTGANSRQAAHYRSGRVLLVGDAAHVHSSVGGPGLNLGMQDALNLGWKLAAEILGWAPTGLLDTYESERHPVGRRVVMHTRAQTALLAAGPNITALRELLGELLDDAANVRRIADLMAGADIRYDTGRGGPAHPLAGRWMPDLRLLRGGVPTRVAALLHGGRPVLLDLIGHPSTTAAAKEWDGRIQLIQARIGGGAPAADAAVDAAAVPARVMLIRPDGYVVWAANSVGPTTAAELRQALADWFGAPTRR